MKSSLINNNNNTWRQLKTKIFHKLFIYLEIFSLRAFGMLIAHSKESDDFVQKEKKKKTFFIRQISG